MSLINIGAGLSAMGESVAHTAGEAALSQQRTHMEDARMLLADQLMAAREKVARDEEGAPEKKAAAKIALDDATLRHKALYGDGTTPTTADTGDDDNFLGIPGLSRTTAQAIDPKTLEDLAAEWHKPQSGGTGSVVSYYDPKARKIVELHRNLADIKPFTDEDRKAFGLDKDDRGYMENNKPVLLKENEALVKTLGAGNKIVWTKKVNAEGAEAPPDAYTPIKTDTDELKSYGAQAKTGQPLTQILPGYRGSIIELRQKVRAEAIKQIQEDTNMSNSDASIEYANRSVTFLAGKASAVQLERMLGATKQSVAQLKFNVGKVKEEMAKLPSTNLLPIFNALIRGEEKWTGEPAYSSLFYYMSTTLNEAARLQSGGQASAAQLHTSAMEDAKQWANMGMTPKSFDAVANAIIAEGENKLETFDTALKSQLPGKLSTPPASPAVDQTRIPFKGATGSALPQGVTEEDIAHTLKEHPEYTREKLLQTLGKP